MLVAMITVTLFMRDKLVNREYSLKLEEGVTERRSTTEKGLI